MRPDDSEAQGVGFHGPLARCRARLAGGTSFPHDRLEEFDTRAELIERIGSRARGCGASRVRSTGPRPSFEAWRDSKASRDADMLAKSALASRQQHERRSRPAPRSGSRNHGAQAATSYQHRAARVVRCAGGGPRGSVGDRVRPPCRSFRHVPAISNSSAVLRGLPAITYTFHCITCAPGKQAKETLAISISTE